jgi:hypothetical protein
LIEIEHIIPLCAPCIKCKTGVRRTKFKFALRKAMLKEMELEPPEGEEAK